MRKAMKTLFCTLGPGGFSDERVFRIKLYGGAEHIGVSSSIYCWTKAGDARQPAVQAGHMIEGRVAARVLSQSNGSVRVSVPDGEIVEVPKELLADMPAGEEDDVSF